MPSYFYQTTWKGLLGFDESDRGIAQTNAGWLAEHMENTEAATGWTMR